MEAKNTNLKWINTTAPIWTTIVKPCHCLNYCPYGCMVEMFPVGAENAPAYMRCETFGHNCPVYYNAEMITEDFDKINMKE